MKLDQKGFTLIEMIVVIVIIAILAAIGVPAIMKYIDDARDTRLIAQAHSVLTASKAMGAELSAKDQLATLAQDQVLWDEIIENADVDGTLVDLSLNTQKSASGDFVWFTSNTYVYYHDEDQSFEILDEWDTTSSLIERVHNTLTNNEAIAKQISDYFQKVSGNSLDSEGINHAPELLEALRQEGFDTSRFSFRIYQQPSIHTITISDQKITTDSVGASINVTQFDYGKQAFTGAYVKKTGSAIVSVKTVEGKKVPYIDLSNTIWEEE